MDKLIKEERAYLINMLKKIKKSGCNVLLIQKSILRDAVTTESLAILAKLKIAVIKDIERDEIDFLCRSLGCKPVSDVDAFTEDKLGYAELCEESLIQECKVVQITGVRHAVGTGAAGNAPSGAANSGTPVGARGGTVSILAMGSNQLVLDETERSLHDALCVVRCLVKKRHAKGEINAGINVRKGLISNILEEDVVQPLLVSTSAIELATETVALLLKVDDYHMTR
ncbi:T-complex protein 1 subunit delta [Serendipita sp. 401]|nr:T-complex protein 1 subunit delta [Serendipita sp. 401]